MDLPMGRKYWEKSNQWVTEVIISNDAPGWAKEEFAVYRDQLTYDGLFERYFDIVCERYRAKFGEDSLDRALDIDPLHQSVFDVIEAIDDLQQAMDSGEPIDLR
ncbi:hypothetical protein [Fundicoccus culcitae]|uniref:Colicin D immunity protein domain-containing protein n=1 Tax=Fundicoccus culcitae TaxID=2969821 RepID=A0ABY5P977_9LACT|nr:hypothetical protein [Fundicoccus culcitae]UUX35015.1 hypothetical protein NRE15_05055 [Fundicoccus culcitae]